MNEAAATEASTVIAKAGSGNANLIYVLYLIGLFTGITALVGVIMAYLNKDEGPDFVRTHYRFQIRTFWIGFLMLVVSAFSWFFVIGIFIGLFWLVWTIVRVLKGMKYLGNGEAHPNPDTWLFS